MSPPKPPPPLTSSSSPSTFDLSAQFFEPPVADGSGITGSTSTAADALAFFAYFFVSLLYALLSLSLIITRLSFELRKFCSSAAWLSSLAFAERSFRLSCSIVDCSFAWSALWNRSSLISLNCSAAFGWKMESCSIDISRSRPCMAPGSLAIRVINPCADAI